MGQRENMVKKNKMETKMKIVQEKYTHEVLYSFWI